MAQPVPLFPGMSYARSLSDNSLILNMDAKEYETPHGINYSSILHPDNCDYRANLGYYDDKPAPSHGDNLLNHDLLEKCQSMVLLNEQSTGGIPEEDGDNRLQVYEPLSRSVSPLPYPIAMNANYNKPGCDIPDNNSLQPYPADMTSPNLSPSSSAICLLPARYQQNLSAEQAVNSNSQRFPQPDDGGHLEMGENPCMIVMCHDVDAGNPGTRVDNKMARHGDVFNNNTKPHQANPTERYPDCDTNLNQAHAMHTTHPDNTHITPLSHTPHTQTSRHITQDNSCNSAAMMIPSVLIDYAPENLPGGSTKRSTLHAVLAETGRIQQSFELEEIQSADTTHDELQQGQGHQTQNKATGLLVRDISLQSDSSGFVESLDCLEEKTLPGRYSLRGVDVDRPLVEGGSVESNEQQPSVSSVRTPSRLQTMASKAYLKHVSQLVEKPPSHQMERFITNHQQQRNGSTETGSEPRVGKLVNIEFDAGIGGDNLRRLSYPKEQDPWINTTFTDPRPDVSHTAAMLDLCNLLAADSDLTLCASDDNLDPILEETDVFVPHNVARDDTVRDRLVSVDGDDHRRSTEELGKLLAESMQSSSEEVGIKSTSSVSSETSSDSDSILVSFKPMTKCKDVESPDTDSECGDEVQEIFTGHQTQTINRERDTELIIPVPEQPVKSSHSGDGGNKRKKKEKRKKEPKFLKKLARSTAATGYDLTRVDPSSRQDDLDTSGNKTRSKKPVVLSELVKATTPTGHEVSNMEPDSPGENLRKSDKCKNSAITALARSTAASTYEMARLQPTQDACQWDDAKFDHPFSDDYENNNNKLDIDDQQEIIGSKDDLPTQACVTFKGGLPEHGAINGLEITDQGLPRSSEPEESPVQFDTKRPSFLTADYEMLTKMVEPDPHVDLSDLDSDSYDDAQQSMDYFGIDHLTVGDHSCIDYSDVSMETALSEPYTDLTVLAVPHGDNVSSDLAVIAIKRSRSTSSSSNSSSASEETQNTTLLDVSDRLNPHSSWPVDADVRIHHRESPLSSDIDAHVDTSVNDSSPAADPVWDKTLTNSDMKYLDNLAISLAVPPPTSTKDPHAKRLSGHSQLCKRSASVDLISELGNEDTKPDAKLDHSPISKFIKMLHHKPKTDKQKTTGSNLKKSESIANPDDLRKRREKGLKISKPNLLMKRRKNRSKSEPGKIDPEEIQKLSSTSKKKEKSDSKGLKWLKNILPSPKSKVTKDTSEMSNVQQSEDNVRKEISPDVDHDGVTVVPEDVRAELSTAPPVLPYSQAETGVAHAAETGVPHAAETGVPHAPQGGGIHDAISQLALLTLPMNPEVPAPSNYQSAESEVSSNWGLSDSDAEECPTVPQSEDTLRTLAAQTAGSTMLASMVHQSTARESLDGNSQFRKNERTRSSQSSMVSEVHIDLKRVKGQQKSEVMLFLEDGEIKEMKHGDLDASYCNHSDDVALLIDRDNESGVSSFKNHPAVSQQSIAERRNNLHQGGYDCRHAFRRKVKPTKDKDISLEDDVFLNASPTSKAAPEASIPREVSTHHVTVSQSDSSDFTVLPTTAVTSQQLSHDNGILIPDKVTNFIPQSAEQRPMTSPQDVNHPVQYVKPQDHFFSSPNQSHHGALQTGQLPVISHEAAGNQTPLACQSATCFCDSSITKGTPQGSGRELICQHKILCHLLRQPAINHFPVKELLGESPMWNYPPSGDIKQLLMREIGLLQYSLHKYRVELQGLELRSSAVCLSVDDQLSPQERREVEELRLLRQSILEEIAVMENHLQSHHRALLTPDSADTKCSLPVDLASLQIVHEMIELLKEQIYHSNVIGSMKQAAETYPPKHLVNETETSADREQILIHQMALLQRQVEVQQVAASNTLSVQLKQLESRLMEEINYSVHAATQNLKLESTPGLTNSGIVYGDVARNSPSRPPVTMMTSTPLKQGGGCHSNMVDDGMTMLDTDDENFYVINVSSEAVPSDEHISVCDLVNLRAEMQAVDDNPGDQCHRDRSQDDLHHPRDSSTHILSQRDSGYKEGEELFV